MDEAEMRNRFGTAAFAVLATHGPDERLDLVPCCHALLNWEGRVLVATAIDHKPKRDRRLARLHNIERNTNVSLLVDHRTDDWTGLWWVRVNGVAAIETDGALHQAVVDSLVAKYPQYRSQAPEGPAIVVDPVRWSGWAWTT